MKLRTSQRSLLLFLGLLLGAIAVYCVIEEAGARATWSLVLRALPYLPIALVLEGSRIITEVMAARGLFALLKVRVPTKALVKAQFVGYSICNVMPVGRMACEAAKAGILAADASLATTAAVGAITQALHLLASAVILVPCIVAARWLHVSPAITAAIAVQCGILFAVGTVVFAAAYFAPARAKLLGRAPAIARALESFRASIRTLPSFPVAALAWLVMTRLLQVVLMIVLARALSAPLSIAGAFVAQGALQMGASAFDFVPGQVGALEGVFRFFASAIGISPADAVAMALLIHVVQACWVLVGAVILSLRRRRPNPHGAAIVLSARSLRPSSPIGWGGEASAGQPRTPAPR